MPIYLSFRWKSFRMKWYQKQFKCVSIGANRVYAKISDTWQILPRIFGDVVRKVSCFIHGTPHSHQCSTYSKLPSSLLCRETYRSWVLDSTAYIWKRSAPCKFLMLGGKRQYLYPIKPSAVSSGQQMCAEGHRREGPSLSRHRRFLLYAESGEN